MSKAHLVNLASNGYFPEELPPPFNTEHFGLLIDINLTKYREIDKKSGSKWTAYCRHNLARSGRVKRVLAILHPKSFFRIADIIQKNWTQIDSFIRKSNLSKTAPVWCNKSGRAIERESSLEAKPIYRAEIANSSRYLLISDVERFFPSVYTHTIPWALLGKDKAKELLGKRRLSGTLGDQIDVAIRSGQSGQTIGIPIGPDTSRVIAEILLAAVDRRLPSKTQSNGMRFVDDYEFACPDEHTANKTFTELHESLSHYELSPNLNKTEKFQLPYPLDPEWILELREFPLHTTSSPKNEFYKFHRFFETVTRLAAEYPNDSVYKWAVKKLSSIKTLHKSNWNYIFNQLTMIAVNDPSCLDSVFHFIQRFKNLGYPVPKNSLKHVLNEIIATESSLRHSSFVAWAIWGCLVFELKISAKNVKSLSDIDDVVVALLTLHARQNKLLSGTRPRFPSWAALMTKEALSSDMWLLSYEARIKGWLPSKGARNHLSGDPLFAYFQRNGLEFYDTDEVKRWRMKKRGAIKPPRTRLDYSGY